MSDEIKHECAVSMIRLRRDPGFYRSRYGTSAYAFRQMTLLLEKQHNRGQDGAGIAALVPDSPPGTPAYELERSVDGDPLAEVVSRIGAELEGRTGKTAQESCFSGSLLLGHLRYGTFGGRTLDACQPLVRENGCVDRTLLLAGNFNFTNNGEILDFLRSSGHYLPSTQDSRLVLQLLAHELEMELKRSNAGTETDFRKVFRRTFERIDGAYVFCCVSGSGDAFALRDPAGIRPGFFLCDDEVVAVASEKVALMTVFNCPPESVRELPPGGLLHIFPDGSAEIVDCLPQKKLRRCVFERIYFSRGNDGDIHRERKAMGRALLPAVLKACGGDLEHTFFSYIPNTAQISFHGLLESLLEKRSAHPRFGQIAVKDAKLRTFISDRSVREEFSRHVYDVTYGLLHPGEDTLVVLDDSIVRGNTLTNAILPMLDRLEPRKVVVCSAAPPVRYPDCYGIDMGSLKELAAFRALVSLLEKNGKMLLLAEACAKARDALASGKFNHVNPVRDLYRMFSERELIREIARQLRPADFHAEFEIVFQTEKSLAKCCPEHRGDWYFSGDYPTPGGYKVVCQALVNFCGNRDGRAY